MFSQSTILVSAVSLDIYQENGPVLPGGGCLNMAYHWWWQLDFPRHKSYFSLSILYQLKEQPSAVAMRLLLTFWRSFGRVVT